VSSKGNASEWGAAAYRKIPWRSYFSDRNDARASGDAVGRALLKLRDYLIEMRKRSLAADEDSCDGAIHLLCHSMGNYVLQCALSRISEFSAGGKLPRVFDHIFTCAPDVADDVFERGKPMERLPEMARTVTIYRNRGDLSMPVSEYTKGNTDRIGWWGPSRCRFRRLPISDSAMPIMDSRACRSPLE